MCSFSLPPESSLTLFAAPLPCDTLADPRRTEPASLALAGPVTPVTLGLTALGWLSLAPTPRKGAESGGWMTRMTVMTVHARSGPNAAWRMWNPNGGRHRCICDFGLVLTAGPAWGRPGGLGQHRRRVQSTTLGVCTRTTLTVALAPGRPIISP